MKTTLMTVAGATYATVSTRTTRTEYPVVLELNEDVMYDDDGIALSVSEARCLADELRRAADEAEEESLNYVQVRFLDSFRGVGGRLYTYLDPSGSLQVGDTVIAGYTSGRAVVQALGKGDDFDGPYKALTAKVVPL